MLKHIRDDILLEILVKRAIGDPLLLQCYTMKRNKTKNQLSLWTRINISKHFNRFFDSSRVNFLKIILHICQNICFEMCNS